jgi:hypothetical protein
MTMFLPSGTFTDCIHKAPEALFSKDGKYRYFLTRRWGTGLRWIAWIGLNPSTADAIRDDPTIRRCIAYSREWDYDGMIMLNIFTLRSTDPKKLYESEDPVGPENNKAILEACKFAETRLCCWGNHGKLKSRGWEVSRLLKDMPLQVLGTTSKKMPCHPLYLQGTLRPQLWVPA